MLTPPERGLEDIHHMHIMNGMLPGPCLLPMRATSLVRLTVQQHSMSLPSSLSICIIWPGGCHRASRCLRRNHGLLNHPMCLFAMGIASARKDHPGAHRILAKSAATALWGDLGQRCGVTLGPSRPGKTWMASSPFPRP